MVVRVAEGSLALEAQQASAPLWGSDNGAQRCKLSMLTGRI
jgi:hypothetical protein